MTEKTRAEKIAYIIWAIHEVEGVEVPEAIFEGKTEEELEEDIKWYDYLLTK